MQEKSFYHFAANKKERALALADMAGAYDKLSPVLRTVGTDLYFNIAPNNVSVRDGFKRRDYDRFRPEERLPTEAKSVIKACMDAYENNGILRNIVDLMGDFSSQGIDVNHPNEAIEKFHKEWFRKINGRGRSERFLNILYRAGNVIVQRKTGKLTSKSEKQFKRIRGEADIEIEKDQKVYKREIPWQYHFLNPLSVDILSEPLARFLNPNQYQYGLKLPRDIANKIKYPKTAAEKAVVAELPKAFVEAIKSGSNLLPLDSDKIRVFHYKKDDWQLWARPMAASILPDFQMLQKMKLADLAALDGAISCIRVWKLGSLDKGILPSAGMMLRLAEMLTNNVGGGVMDLVWGPDIDLIETNTDVHRFLGESKYAPVLNAIFQGLGIPPTLTGTQNPGGFTNNFISLKTLIERLQYGRDQLQAFWEEELRLLQRAMGFRIPASISFDNLLTDEAAEKKLIIELLDRDIISMETVQEFFGLTPEIEQVRIRRETRKRKQKMTPPKASPFHQPQHMENLQKIFATSGGYAPSEFGVELQEKRPGEASPAEVQAQGKAPEDNKPKGSAGRPTGSRDIGNRKRKDVKPRTSASDFASTHSWATDALQKIGKMISPPYLASLNKKTLRELTDGEVNTLESVKFSVLCNLKVGEEISKGAVLDLLKANCEPTKLAQELLEASIKNHAQKSGKEPTLDVLRTLQATVYAACVEEENLAKEPSDGQDYS